MKRGASLKCVCSAVTESVMEDGELSRLDLASGGPGKTLVGMRAVSHNAAPRVLLLGGDGFLRWCMAFPAFGAILLGSDGAARVFWPSRF